MKRFIKTSIVAAAAITAAAAFAAPALAADNIRIIVVSHGQANDRGCVKTLIELES